MNQIIAKPEKKKLENTSLCKLKNKKKIWKVGLSQYRFQFLLSFFVALIFLGILGFKIYVASEQEKLSKQLLRNYTLTTLYQSSTTNHVVEKQAVSYENPFVIGMIKIDKINLNYPILSQTDRDLLKISLCRFAGPMPNEVGNLCIAGHNYVDYKLFSRLHELEKNDTIELYDLNGKKILYTVYDKYEVEPDDLSCTDQNVGENKILTLLTCNNVNGKRTIVKAKEKI